MKKRVYICGKVTGEDYDSCFQKFYDAEKMLRDLNFEPVNPVQIVRSKFMLSSPTWEEAMRICIAELMTCRYILVLGDAHNSRGAKLELSLAYQLGIETLIIKRK